MGITEPKHGLGHDPKSGHRFPVDWRLLQQTVNNHSDACMPPMRTGPDQQDIHIRLLCGRGDAKFRQLPYNIGRDRRWRTARKRLPNKCIHEPAIITTLLSAPPLQPTRFLPRMAQPDRLLQASSRTARSQQISALASATVSSDHRLAVFLSHPFFAQTISNENNAPIS